MRQFMSTPIGRPATWATSGTCAGTSCSNVRTRFHRREVELGQVEADRALDLGGQLGHPRQLAGDHAVLTRELVDALAGRREGRADAEQLVAGGERAGDELAVDRAVQRRARRREAQRARVERLVHQRGHLRDVVRRGRLVGGAAVAHDVRPQRAVRHLGAEIDRERPPRERVEVLRERLPLPGDALGHRGARDVFDALHQPDEPGVAVRRGGREPDAAVAHDRGRDAVPARRRQHRIPRGLRVVVRVQIDEPGRDEQARSVDLTAPAPDGADRRDAASVEGEIPGERWLTRPVDDRPAPNHYVVHVDPSCPSCSYREHDSSYQA
jgi:hypothetical protein